MIVLLIVKNIHVHTRIIKRNFAQIIYVIIVKTRILLGD